MLKQLLQLPRKLDGLMKNQGKLISAVENNRFVQQDLYLKVQKKIEQQMLLVGQSLSAYNGSLTFDNLQQAEFKVFSQWGDDGIIQYLVNRIQVAEKSFIEFGVENYTEANTRFLLINNNWKGLVIDGSQANVDHIKRDEIYWKYELQAVCAFIDAENINQLIQEAGFSGEIGLLHIDIDGNDFWVWKAIQVINPVIAIIEYNSLFGIDRAITIPYDAKFYRMRAHHSGLYAGASLLALCELATEKGYSFVGSNSAGNNAYFVRKDKVSGLKVLQPSDGYVRSRFREHRDERGEPTYKNGFDAIKELVGLKVYNTRTNTLENLF